MMFFITCADTGAARLGPPGLGGDNLGLFSNVPASQSFLTGGGTGVVTVAIDTSPENDIFLIENKKKIPISPYYSLKVLS